MKNPKPISQGAEAKIYLETRTDTPKIIKHRLKKSYRHPELDTQIRRRRTKSEAKIIEKALEAKINVPKIEYMDKTTHKLYLEYIDGERLSETLNDKPEKEQFKIMKLLGEQVSKLHKKNLIHGDLTTSNTILRKKNKSSQLDYLSSGKRQSKKGGSCGSEAGATRSGESVSQKVFIIDFGLGFVSTKIEDKAVDLHLIKQALEAKHFQNHEDLFKNFLKGYKKENPEYKKITEQLKRVEARGRYKH